MPELGAFQMDESSWRSVFELVFVDEESLDYSKGRRSDGTSRVNHIVQERINCFLEPSEQVRNSLATHTDFGRSCWLDDVVDESLLVWSNVYGVVIGLQDYFVLARVVFPFYHATGNLGIVVRSFVRVRVGTEVSIRESAFVGVGNAELVVDFLVDLVADSSEVLEVCSVGVFRVCKRLEEVGGL